MPSSLQLVTFYHYVFVKLLVVLDEMCCRVFCLDQQFSFRLDIVTVKNVFQFSVM